MITKNEISSLNLSPTKKDFVQIWNELMEVASKITERWDPTSTNESDPGIVLLKVLTGIADKLNYNIDKNILEAYMPTAAQMESMRKLCELMGYDIKYYQSAETKVKIKYTGNTNDEEERLPSTGLPLPKFTTVTNADKDITFVTTNTVPVYITNENPWVEVSCIEGQIGQCESINESNLITPEQLDDEYRYYLPEVQIAENGIFVYNAAITNDGSYIDGTPWQQVSNLNTKSPETRVFKFGYDSLEGRPYLVFPKDINSLIGDGLFIYFTRTSGVNGNISHRTLEILEVPTGNSWDNYSAEQFEVVNENAAVNGANIENISTAYTNFKKTVGTFDTLVTCRDYMNKIYSLMDASNSPYVSNILVTDIRNDINSAITLCSCNEFGILYKELPLTRTVKDIVDVTIENSVEVKSADAEIEIPLIDHFDLVLYPFKTFTQVSSGTKDLVGQYNKSFTYSELPNREIATSLDEFKTCAHNFVTPVEGDLVSINNYLRLNALVATSSKVSELEAKAILQNIKIALVNEFNMRNLDFGEEIPFDSILSTIENADARIKVVSLQEPRVLTTYSVKVQQDGEATSKEYGILSTAPDIKINGVTYTQKARIKDETTNAEAEVEVLDGTAKAIYNKLVLRNILAGRAALFDYDETFISNNSEKPYTVTKEITNELPSSDPNDPIKIAIDKIMSNPELVKIDEHILYDDDTGKLIRGSRSGVLTLKILRSEAGPASLEPGTEAIAPILETELLPSESSSLSYKLYETYKPSFSFTSDGTVAEPDANKPSTVSPSIINNIARVEAICEIKSNNDVFENITLSKNEVIKFRAPNLITTKTFPAYVYYRFERAISEAIHDNSTSDGSYAAVMSLKSFINSIGVTQFFGGGEKEKKKYEGLWKKVFDTSKNSLKHFTASVTLKKENDKVVQVSQSASLDQSEQIPTMFNTSIVCGVIDKEFEELTTKNDISVARFCLSRVNITDYLAEKGDEWGLGKDNGDTGDLKVTFIYYPLTTGTMPVWGEYLKECYKIQNNRELPDNDTILWRLSSTSSFPKGRLVTEAGQRLYAQGGEFLLNTDVGATTYICMEHGTDPIFSSIPPDSDVELRKGDKLYIHYTPSSTNEDGETENAEPVSIVYEGGSTTDPVILRPSGFTLMPSDNVYQQGTSWKKTGVDFGSYGKKNLLALAPNEQIELRSISKVILSKPARFYKNFDDAGLEQGDINKPYSYELKDGEYIFYTDQNNQEAAYYGSGSVVTLSPGAYIPKASDTVEVSQILEQGLHIVPWSNFVLLNETKTVTVTEYQYVTLTDGDTLNALTVIPGENGSTLSKYEWLKCNQTEQDGSPVIYTMAGAETATTLPKIHLGPDSSIGWEVCSFLELSASPGYTQQLRATDSVTNKVNIYTSSSSDGRVDYVIQPERSAPTGEYEKVSLRLSTIIQSATGSFEKKDLENEESTSDVAKPVNLQMKVFKEETPLKIELTEYDDVITPISAVHAMDASASSDNINSYFTRVGIKELLRLVEERTTEKDDEGNEITVSKWVSKPNALKLNFMIPSDRDVFGVFSVYLDTPIENLSSTSKQNMLKGPSKNELDQEILGSRVFIDLPPEFGPYQNIISIYNNDDSWWSEGIDEKTPNRLYLRAGLNCIKVTGSCSILLKAEANANGSLLYDNIRLVKGIKTNGINLALLDPDTTFNVEAAHITEIKTKAKTELDKVKLAAFEAEETAFENAKTELANEVLAKIKELDANHDFYYNVPVENSLAIEFDDNINAFSNPYTLYDINNVNNSFVISKLDVDYLDTGLSIAKSSRY